MALPRSKYVKEGQEGVYHCFSRCVRRAFLCGFDTAHTPRLLPPQSMAGRQVAASRRHFRHRSLCLRRHGESLPHHSAHSPRHRRHLVRSGSGNPLADTLPSARMPPCRLPTSKSAPWLIARNVSPQLRKRLCSLSWFMGRLNEFIARAANKEDRSRAGSGNPGSNARPCSTKQPSPPAWYMWI